MKPLQRAFRIAGWCAVASAGFWMVTGMGWWAPVISTDSYPEFMRGVAICAAHGFLIVVGLMTYDDNVR